MVNTLFPSLPILLVDDEEAWLNSFSLTLRSNGITNISTCQDSREVMRFLSSQRVSVIVLDLTMPHISGNELLPMIAGEHPDTPVIIITGLDMVETAVECMKAGAFEYFTKVSEEDRLINGVRRAIDFGLLQRENRAIKNHFLKDRLEHPEAFNHIITHSKSMRSLFLYIEAISVTDKPVLITGETGVGKELVAQALHTLSSRTGPFVPVNVAGLDDTMFTDTLFGHRKGAFTGADTARPGVIEQAAGGTLFLDEIGDLNISSQVKFLRLLQEGEYLPLGADLPKRTDTRMIFATQCNLKEHCDNGTFRRDLYYRLSTHHIHIPPLKDRLEDIPPLLNHFLEEAAAELGKKKPSYPKELEILLKTYHYPGNVRELKNMVMDAMTIHTEKILSMDSFKAYIGNKGEIINKETALDTTDSTPFSVLETLPTLKEAGHLLVLEALKRADNNQSIAADMLGITRQALNWRLKQYDKTMDSSRSAVVRLNKLI
jgi:DNA-binding NtrC family response regulator